MTTTSPSATAPGSNSSGAASPAPASPVENGAGPGRPDLERVQQFAEQVAAALTGGATTAMMVLGDRLGLYRELARSGPVTSEQLAAATGTTERYVREWLAQQASVGFLGYDQDAGTFALGPEESMVLATDETPASLIGCAPMITGFHRATDRMVAAMRSGDGIPWGEQDATIFESTERFFGTNYRTFLLSEWVPAVDGLLARLRSGARVADVGTGYGLPLRLLAEAFPASSFVGYDAHEGSVRTARERAAEAGLSDRLTFEVADAGSYSADGYDLVTFFDALHDLGDPVSAARHAREALTPDGVLVLVEPRAADDLATTIETIPTAGLGYAASTFLCTPNSRSQPVGLALGAHAGVARLREVLAEAGFARVRLAAETPFNVVLEARP